MTEPTSIFQAYREALEAFNAELQLRKGAESSMYFDYGINVIFRDFADKLGFDRKQIKGHLLLLNEPPSLDIKTSYTLREMLESQSDASSWIVPRLYRKSGLYIVGAAPKSFKSLSMYDLAYALTTSGMYLDEIPCAKGKVIYFQCEEPQPTIQNRLRDRGFGEDGNVMDEDLFRIERKFNIKTDLNYLTEYLVEYDPMLCIFDSLRAITSSLDVSENSVEFSKYIYALQRVFILYNKTGIIIHHKNKTSNTKGLNQLSGSLAIAGATDGIVLMEPDNLDSSKVLLNTIPRDGAPISLVLRRNKLPAKKWKFTLDEELNVNPNLIIMERKLMRYLSNNGDLSLTEFDLAKALGVAQNNGLLSEAIDRLLEGDILSCKKSAIHTGLYEYSLPKDSPWLDADLSKLGEGEVDNTQIVSTASTNAFISIEAKLANILCSKTNKKEVLELTKDWGDALKTSIWALMIPSERERIEELVKQPAFAVGDQVGEYTIYKVELDEVKQLYLYSIEDKEDAKTVYEAELLGV